MNLNGFLMKSFILVLGLLFIALHSSAQFQNLSLEMGVFVKHENTELGNGASFYDFNHDGWDDLTTANGDSAIQFFVNSGSGILEEMYIDLPMTVTHQVIALIWVDYDNDGDSDLFTSQDGGRIYLFANDGNFNFSDVTELAGLPVSSYRYYGASFADVNKDGFLDFYLSKYYNPIVNPQSEFSSQFYLNNGDGTFVDATVSSGLQQPPSPSFQSVFFDYNKDGHLDLFIIVDRAMWSNELFRNNGDGTFTEVTNAMGAAVGSDSMCANVGDFDNDLDLDVYATDGPSGNVLLENKFPFAFSNIAETHGVEINQSCWGSLWIDAENDGFQDLFIGTTVGLFTSAPNRFFKNLGSDGFEEMTEEYGIGEDVSPTMCTVMGDINNDGYYDYFNNNNDPFRSDLWVNQGGANNFIAMTFEGTFSNKDAVGTNVKAYYGGNQAMRLKHTGESYLAQNSGKEIFGLNEIDLVDSLVIEWPNGLIEKYYNVVANHFYHFIEGNAPTQNIELVSLDSSICPGQIILLDGGEGQSWLWSDGYTERFYSVSNPGEYQVQVTDQNGIIYLSNQISFSEQIQPTTEITSYNPTCFNYSNGLIQFDYSYEESTLLYLNNEVIFNIGENLPAGIYNYSIISQSGCSTSGVVILEEPEEVVAEFISENPLCHDGLGQIEITSINGGSTPYFTDYFGQNPGSIPSGEYTFLIVDSQGCPFVGEYQIISPESIQLELSSSPQIDDSPGLISINAFGGTGSLEYFLNGESIGNIGSIEVLTGTYIITVVDENGCSHSEEIEVGFEVSVDEIENQFTFYPNPATEEFTLEVRSSDLSKSLFVYSAQGKLVLAEKINSFITNIDASNWSEGIYLLKIGDEQKMLIKQ